MRNDVGSSLYWIDAIAVRDDGLSQHYIQISPDTSKPVSFQYFEPEKDAGDPYAYEAVFLNNDYQGPIGLSGETMAFQGYLAGSIESYRIRGANNVQVEYFSQPSYGVWSTIMDEKSCDVRKYYDL